VTRAALLFLLAATACTDKPRPDQRGAYRTVADTTVASDSASASARAASRTDASARSDSLSAYPAVAVLRNVRAAGHGDFDRIVFEFEGPTPPYVVSYTDVPVSQCGSGAAVSLPGTAILTVRISPANAHTEEGRASGAPHQLKAAGDNILEMRQTSDFEAVVLWAVALKHARRYSVRELSAPARVIIDLEH